MFKTLFLPSEKKSCLGTTNSTGEVELDETPEKEVNVTESDNISDGKTIPLYNVHVDFYCEKQKLTIVPFSLQEQKLQENLLMKIQTSHRKI